MQFIVCYAEDITDNFRTEEALQVNEEKYRLIFENSPVGIIHYDKDAIITACNEAFINIFKTKYKDIIGSSLLDFIENPKLKKEFESTFHGKYAHYEGEFISPVKRNTIYMEADFAPIFSEQGVIVGGAGIIQDISKRIETKQTILENGKVYREFVENMNDVAWLSEGNKIIYVNPAFEKIFKLQEDNPSCDISMQFESIHPEDKDLVSSIFKGKKFHKDKKFDFKFRIINSDGSIRWLWARSFIITDEDDEIYRIAGIATDITNQMEL